ncbi:MAG: peptidase M14 [Deltaproteobacteria bacterium]|nr:peptidase M14 [Deltaproteobacteria bacterium]MDQ3297675.1 peptidase M14 [Myxococcota bacterium]
MRHALVGLVVVSAVVSACGGARSPRPSLVSTAEQSQYQRTGRYDEAVRLCHDFARAYDHVRCDEIGRTVEDRPLLALRIARRPNLPMIYIQAAIHAGEIEGKDAGFVFLRDLLDGKVAPGALDAVSIVFVPVVNPDGHERFGPNHRPNQRGPLEMGFRTNAARLNLNRDFVKADAPETQAVLGLLRTTDLVLFVDLHTTDGAKFEHDISTVVSPYAPRADGLDEAAHALSTHLQQRLTALGHLPLPFYPSFNDENDPASGFSAGEAPPRFGNYYMASRGRLALLVETHSWRTYPERAKSTYHTLQIVLEHAIEHARGWRELSEAVSRADAALAGKPVTLLWKMTTRSRELEFRGYAYEKRTSELTTGTWLVYDEQTPQIWKVPYFEEVEPSVTVTAPGAGYIIDGGFAPLVARVLAHHGITFTAIRGEPRVAVEAYRATKATFGAPYEGRQRATITGAWAAETRTLERGAIFVPIAQPTARLVMHLFEPALPDSLAQWGHFNVVFERKEYMEPYVVEEVARAMLAADPALRAAFDAALAADPELAKSAELRRDFFYRRHPAWDERVELLPVYRTATAP